MITIKVVEIKFLNDFLLCVFKVNSYFCDKMYDMMLNEKWREFNEK